MDIHRRVSPAAERGRASVGLIGLLIVTAIGLYLLFGNMGGTSSMNEVKKGREQGQRVGIDMQSEQLITVITQYQLANDTLPQTMADIEAPPNAYLDPWGTQIRFTCEEDRRGGKGVIHIVSAGPDGEFDTEDDLTVTRDLPI